MEWWSSNDQARKEKLEEELAGRQKLRMMIQREELRLEPSSQRGLFVAPVIRRQLGFANRILSLDILHLPPGCHCEAQRNPEALMHIIDGRGYTVIEGERYDWERGDTLHIKQGYWHQHYNLDPHQPAHMLWATIEPLIEYLRPLPTQYKGDSFSDVDENYIPPHPFGYDSKPIETVGGEKWMSHVHLQRKQRIEAQKEALRQGRTIYRARDIQMERSEHKGDFIVGISDQALGFANQVVRMHLQQLPPGSHTETHRHDEAIVYVLKGRGYSLMDGVRYDWRQGDCMFIPPYVWHQHWNLDPDNVSQHIAITWIPLQEKLGQFAEIEQRKDGDFTPPPEGYVPLLPWQQKSADQAG